MPSTLQEHQVVLLGMLKEFDRICRKYDIKYMLFAGTALGAVRHGGFIPWDDDLDVILLRSEYQRFLAVAPGELDASTYYLQKEFSEHWPMFFSKLRKNNTACIERYIPRDSKVHQGVYIDIFPCDNLSDEPAKRYFQFVASKIVIAQSLSQRGYLTKDWKKKAFIICSKVFSKDSALSYACDKTEGQSELVHSFFGASSEYKKSIYKREWFENFTYVKFEDGEFPISKNYHDLLKTLYGDYMKPTPQEQRGVKVHAEIVDLNHSYLDYIGVQKKMNFEELTRSIR